MITAFWLAVSEKFMTPIPLAGELFSLTLQDWSKVYLEPEGGVKIDWP